MTRTYYHVAGSEYQEGDALLSLDKLEEVGIEVEWKWEDADYGLDADVVCVFDNIEEAQWFKADFAPGGKILKIEIAQEDIDEPTSWKDGYGGTIYPRMTTVEEGYTAFYDGIPAAWITEIVS